MSVFIASNKNLRILKKILMADYEVKSSHASELIAALCGFNTYAALLSQLRSADYAPATFVDFDNFERRHNELGYNRASGPLMRFSFNHLTLADTPWLLHTSNQQYQRDQWYHRAEKMSVPFITIIQKRKYFYLEWDCISIDPKNEDKINKVTQIEQTRNFFKLYQFHARHKEPMSFFNGNAFYGTIEKMSEGFAKEMADIYFMLLTPWKFSQ